MNKIFKFINLFVLLILLIVLVSCDEVGNNGEETKIEPTAKEVEPSKATETKEPTESKESTIPTESKKPTIPTESKEPTIPTESKEPTIPEIKETEYMYFGKYPQTVVEDEELSEILKGLDERNDNGFYEYEGIEYEKLFHFIDDNSEDDSESEEESYEEIFYKVEPLLWRVLEKDDESITLITDLIIDAIKFAPSVALRIIDGTRIQANNYEHSFIREWLNNEFYDYAFTEEEQEQILISFIDNSNRTTFSRQTIVCNDTNDKVYLLSYREAEKFFDDKEDKKAYLTDFSYALGAGMCQQKENQGVWRLRSPWHGNTYYSAYVDCNGEQYHYSVDDDGIGARPVIRIQNTEKE